MNGNKVKVMAQGAMLASLFGVLGVINLYTGSIFDIVLAYVMVIGLVYYTYLYDYRAGLSVLAVTFVILFLVGELFFTFYVTFTLVMGIFYGYCLKHEFALLWIFLFISESYIVRVYSNIIVSKLMKRK